MGFLYSKGVFFFAADGEEFMNGMIEKFNFPLMNEFLESDFERGR